MLGEPRASGLSPYYEFDTIARVGDKTDKGEQITRIEPEVSVNEKGLVVFVGELNGEAENVLLADGRSEIVNISQSPPRNWSFAQINNQDVIVARVLLSGRSMVVTWHASNPGDYDIIATTIYSAFSQLTLPVIANCLQGQQPLIAFLGREGDLPFNLWVNDTGRSNEQERVAYLSGTRLAHFRSMAAETNKRTVVVQYGISEGDGRIAVYEDPEDLGLWDSTLIATNVGWDWVILGRAPGISDSGKVVAFLGFPGADYPGKPGVHIATAAGNFSTGFQVRRAVHDDDVIAQDDAGKPITLTFPDDDFLSVNRVGVLHQELGAEGFEDDSIVIVFVATPSKASRKNPASPDRPLLFTDKRGIWTVRIDVSKQPEFPHELVFHPGTPIPVIQEGDELDGGVVVDFLMYDPISVPLVDPARHFHFPSRGDHYVAFSVALDTNGDGVADENRILRAAYLDTDGDGLVDHWEEKGIDMDGDGLIDLDLPAMGATSLRKDIFLEIDWLNPRTEGVPQGWTNQPAAGVTERLAKMFAEAPVTNLDGSTGITLHIDAGPGKDSVGKPLSVNMGTGPLDGGDEIGMPGAPNKHPDIVTFRTDLPNIEGVSALDVQTIKEECFGKTDKWARELAFKYCIMADAGDLLYDHFGQPYIEPVHSASSTTVRPLLPSLPEATGHLVKIISGKGNGQLRRIIGQTALDLIVDPPWVTVPDSSSVFALIDGGLGTAELFAVPPPYGTLWPWDDPYWLSPGNDFLMTFGGAGPCDDVWYPVGYPGLGNPALQWRTMANIMGRSFGLFPWEFGPTWCDPWDPTYSSLMSWPCVFDFDSGIDSYSSQDWMFFEPGFPFQAPFLGTSGSDMFFSPGPDDPRRSPVVTGTLDQTSPGITITSPAGSFSVGLGNELLVTALAWDDTALSHVLILFDVNGDGRHTGSNETIAAQYDHVHKDFRATFTNVGGVSSAREIIAYAYDTSDNIGVDTVSIKAGGQPPGVQTLLNESGTIPSQPHQNSGGTRQTVTYTSISVPGSGRLTFTVTASPPVRTNPGGGEQHDTAVTRIWLDGKEFSLEPVCNPPGSDPAVCSSFWQPPSGGGSLDVELLGPAVFDAEGKFLGHPSQDYTLKISFEAVDVTPPEVSISSPSAGGFVGITETLLVEMNVTDDYGIQAVEVYFDTNGDGDEDDAGETVAANDLGGGAYRATFPNVAGEAGARRIRVMATDTAGHTSRLTGFVEVRVPDTEPPFVAIQSPFAGWPIEQGDTLTVEVNAYDDVELASVTVMFDMDGDGATTGAGESVLAEKTGVNLYTAEFPNIAGPNGPRTVQVLAADTSMNTSPADVPVTVGGVEPTTETIFTDTGHIDAQPSMWSGGSQQVIDYDPIEIPGSGTLTFTVTATPPVRQEVQNIQRADPYVRHVNFNGTDYNLTPQCNDFGADPSVCTTTFEATEGGTLDFEILGPGTWNTWGEFSGHHAQDYTIEIEFTSVDVTRPEVTITSPAMGANVDIGVLLTVDVSVADESEVASVVVSFDVNGDGDSNDFGEQLAANRIAGNNYRAIFGDLSGIPGTRTIEVLATDTSFNMTRKTMTVGIGGVGGGETFLHASTGTIPAQPIDIHGGKRQVIEFGPITVPGVGRVTLVVTATPNVRQKVQNIERYDPMVVEINFDGQGISLTPACNSPGSDPAVCISVWDSPGAGVLDFEILGPATYNIWGEFQGHPEQDYTVEVLFLPGPSVTDVTPNTGSIGGHEMVTVRGAGFGFNAVVLFGEVPATDVVWVSSEELTCTTPPGVLGSVTVKVLNTDPEGLSWNYGGPYGLFGSLEDGFTYQAAAPPAPLQAERLLGTYKSYFPAVGSEEPQQQASFAFSIPGAGRVRFEAYAFIPILNAIPGPFDDPDNLEWHNESSAVRSFKAGDGSVYWTVVDCTDLGYPYGPVISNATRVVAGGDAGPGQFTVKGPARWNAFWRQFGEYEMVSAPAQTWSLAVWYAKPPSLASVFPISGTEAGGDTVTVTGSNFAQGMKVRFGDVLATNVVVSNENTLTCMTPPGLAGLAPVEIELVDMTVRLNNAFTYEPDVQRKAITDFAFGDVGTAIIRVQTQPGRTYRLQRNSDLTNPYGWLDIGSETPGSGAEEVFVDAMVPAYTPTVFYRFVIRSAGL